MTAAFVKRNPLPGSDAPFREAEGLAALARLLEGAEIGVPRVLAVDEKALTLEAIERGSWSDAAWSRLGRGLAALHAKWGASYGLARDNYLGASPQPNRPAARFGPFFLEYRLRFQVRRVRRGDLRRAFLAVLEAVGGRLAEYLDAHCEGPSPLHGDLWAGNVLCGRDGRVWLIDPAFYFGDREADLAMTELFGGFGEAFLPRLRRLPAAQPRVPPASGRSSTCTTA
ncbi:MAG: hypothetical protein KatS3mg124_2053 [Porticoccaceae bacterium]|nr:MAG: hypothetical protein KatS3mg124_2053 [Porticoccaceae bacterium]